MENKKQEIIRKAWLTFGIPFGSYIDNDGYITIATRLDGIVYEFLLDVQYEQNNLKNEFDILNGKYRPKSLTGIENNNGWITIDNEMKVDNGKYWVRLFNPDTNIESFEVINVLHSVIDYYFATHYQPIVKPSPPIY